MEAKMGRHMHQVDHSSRFVYEVLTTAAESTTPQTIILTSLLDLLGDGFKMKARVTPLTIKAILEVHLQSVTQCARKLTALSSDSQYLRRARTPSCVHGPAHDLHWSS